jgi:hypothetical protein
MNASSHPVIVEYAVRECFKHKSPKVAATATKRKLAGSFNLFVGGGQEIVEIDEQELENQIWLRMAARGVQCIANVKPGKESWALEGVLQEFSQKITPKNLSQLENAIIHFAGKP